MSTAAIAIAAIALMLGVPEEDWHLLFRGINEIIASEDPEYQHGRSSNETNEQAQEELFSYFKELSDQRRGNPEIDTDAVGQLESEHGIRPHRIYLWPVVSCCSASSRRAV